MSLAHFATSPNTNYSSCLCASAGAEQYFLRRFVHSKLKEAIYVFEFKVDGTLKEALEQINSKQYTIPYQTDSRPVIKVGVNFDSATRTISDWKIA